MRPIVKGVEPPSLSEFRDVSLGSYENIHANVKEDIRIQSFAEQFGLCAFCCVRLPQITSLQRVAHIVPRAVDKSRSLDYSNMVLSCSSGRASQISEASAVDQSCDEHQGSQVPPVTPLQPNCTSRFAFFANGQVRSANGDRDADETIRIFHLDGQRLRRARAAAISEAEVERLALIDRGEGHLWEQRLAPENGVLRDFEPAIRALV